MVKKVHLFRKVSSIVEVPFHRNLQNLLSRSWKIMDNGEKSLKTLKKCLVLQEPHHKRTVL